jgi:3-oxoacyl-[acyl-carrier protein] reductase|tara:strand:- start:233 stop:982 length:750 start_codon:yes stop_codon:yes gene_type:complete
MRLDDKVIIVTGAGYGIGKVYSRGLASEGARIVAADIDFEAAKSTARELEELGWKAIPTKTDVSKEEDTIKMADETVQAFGRIDVLINNAAIYSSLVKRQWDEVPIDEWDQVFAVNLKGAYLCAKAVVPYMKKAGKGKIINIASGTVWSGTGNRIHYTTSKAGVIGLTRVLARELGSSNILVNTIAPGLTQTGRANTEPEAYDKSALGRALKRIEYPEDLVGTAAFLASDDSDFITGQTINVEGGGHFL